MKYIKLFETFNEDNYQELNDELLNFVEDGYYHSNSEQRQEEDTRFQAGAFYMWRRMYTFLLSDEEVKRQNLKRDEDFLEDEGIGGMRTPEEIKNYIQLCRNRKSKCHYHNLPKIDRMNLAPFKGPCKWEKGCREPRSYYTGYMNAIDLIEKKFNELI